VPNGGRIYFLDRSQPPLLSEMVLAYFQATGDGKFVQEAFPVL
jgi:alpha,alpha-trehalase